MAQGQQDGRVQEKGEPRAEHRCCQRGPCRKSLRAFITGNGKFLYVLINCLPLM